MTLLKPTPIVDLELDKLPRHSLLDGGIPPDAAEQAIRDELMLDGNARLNLATFVTTWMEPQARALMERHARQEHDRQGRVPADGRARDALREHPLRPLERAEGRRRRPGCSTTGSSEAAMLAGLALKRRWQQARRDAGKPADKPNIVMGINVQVCWEKLANYWDVEMRLVPMEGDRFHLNGEEAVALCDENTIGVVAILGSTFDGAYEPVAEIAPRSTTSRSAPAWTSRCTSTARPAGSSHRSSTRTSNGTFVCRGSRRSTRPGTSTGSSTRASAGSIWRDAEALPEDLIFHVNYLGDDMPTFALNFSRPGAQMVAQYYNFLRLGFEGYARVQGYAREVATQLAGKIEKIGPFRLLTRGDQLPVFAFTLNDDVDTTASSTSHGRCASVAGRCRRTPSPPTAPTSRCCASSSAAASRHDMADMLVGRPEAAATAPGAPGRAGPRRDDHQGLPAQRGSAERRSTQSPFRQTPLALPSSP